MRPRFLLILTVAALGAAPPAHAAQDDERLVELFQRLKEAPGLPQARALERHIWDIWLDSGRKDVNALMDAGMHQMSAGELESALATFAQVVKLAPGFAEGWNKRATVYYLMDDLAHSMRDIQRTLALEPRHFGALSGMALIFLEQGDDADALAVYEKVLEIDPYAPGVRERVEALRARLRGREA
jgi:tetratricopeptide (TPR) repeat protein